jgi:hypothetical protein
MHRFRAPIALGAVSLALLLACGKKDPAKMSCGDRVDAFEQALASPTAGTCAVDTDCKCFPGGVSKKHGCGGISDTKTSATLMSIATEYQKAGCKSGIDCAARVCMPACREGKCTDGPPEAPAKLPAAAEPEAGGPATTCEARAAEIDRVLASATRKCAGDQDCACFRGGVSKKEPCGGIVDAKTNARFETLAKVWSAAGCKGENVACPAMVCETKCNAGTCGPPGMIVQ